MSKRSIMFLAAAAVIGISLMATDAFAWRGGGGRAGGVRVGGAYHGGVYRHGVGRGVYARRGVAVGVGAAAVGAAVAAPYYYGRPACGYYPYPACY
jgi:hypothetical protein